MINDSIGTRPKQLYLNHRFAVQDIEIERKVIDHANRKIQSLRQRAQTLNDRNNERQANIIAHNQNYGFERLEKLEGDYRFNIAEAAGHYALSADVYHEQAIQEAQADGVQIDFQGDVATSVHRTR